MISRNNGAAFAITALFAIAATETYSQDVTEGEKVFKKCAACHAVGEDAKQKVGPVLNGVVGAQAGQIEGFKYSDAMAESGLTWDEETLAAFLSKPKDVVPKSKMTFAGLKDSEDIANLIAYLATFGPDGTTQN